jgi:tetratricopeptide (TPR) repeat protein
MPRLSDAQLRHAQYYATVLAAAEQLYLRGGEEQAHGVKQVELEWDNIQQGQAWASSHAGKEDVAAVACSDYAFAGHVLALSRHPRERLRWEEAALTAARRLCRRDWEAAHLGNVGSVHLDLGEPCDAIQFLEQFLAIAHETCDRGAESIALGNIGTAYAQIGETRRARRVLRTSCSRQSEPAASQKSRTTCVTIP